MLHPATHLTVKARGKKRRRILIAVLAALVDLIAIVTAFHLASLVRLGFIEEDQLYQLLAIMLPLYFFAALNNRAYNVTALVKLGTSYQLSLLSLFFAIIAVLLSVFSLKVSEELSRIIFWLGIIGSAGLLAAGRLIIRQISWHTLGTNPMAELLIHDRVDDKLPYNADAIDAKSYGIHPDSTNPLNIQRLGIAVQEMDKVIVHCHPKFRDDWAHALKALDVNSEIIIPELTALAPLGLSHRDGQISLSISSGPLMWNQSLIKRIFDIISILVALPFLAIPMLITAIAVKLESPGPILFKQSRIGLGNRPFNILKFRSMRTDMGDARGKQSTQRSDKRMTRIGRFIRSTSIDELPQVFNVLAGQMSIVGPRPHALESTAEDALFWNIDDRYWHRHTIKPGLTGLAQVRGFRGATERREDLEGRLQADLEYRTQWSLWNDMKIIALTFRVLMHKNAY